MTIHFPLERMVVSWSYSSGVACLPSTTRRGEIGFWSTRMKHIGFNAAGRSRRFWSGNRAGGPPLGQWRGLMGPSSLLTNKFSGSTVKRNRVAPGYKRSLERFKCVPLEKMKAGRTLEATEETAVCFQDWIHLEVILGTIYSLVRGNKETVN